MRERERERYEQVEIEIGRERENGWKRIRREGYDIRYGMFARAYYKQSSKQSSVQNRSILPTSGRFEFSTE